MYHHNDPKHRSSFHREESKHEIDYDPTLNQHNNAPSRIKKILTSTGRHNFFETQQG